MSLSRIAETISRSSREVTFSFDLLNIHKKELRGIIDEI